MASALLQLAVSIITMLQRARLRTSDSRRKCFHLLNTSSLSALAHYLQHMREFSKVGPARWFGEKSPSVEFREVGGDSQ